MTMMFHFCPTPSTLMSSFCDQHVSPSHLGLQLGPELARQLAAQLPWLRLVASLREPISRQLSMLAHNLHKRRADPSCRRKPYPCLLQSGYLGMMLLLSRIICDERILIQALLRASHAYSIQGTVWGNPGAI